MVAIADSRPASTRATSTSTSRRRRRRARPRRRRARAQAPAGDRHDRARPPTTKPRSPRSPQVAPIVVAANFSLGVNLLLGLVRQAARALGPDWDAEVVETHHRAKRDAPSGTALMIARAIAAGHGVDYDAVKRHTRDGDVGPRPRGEIGVSTVRGGDVIGEHTAYFFGAGRAHRDRATARPRARSSRPARCARRPGSSASRRVATTCSMSRLVLGFDRR